MPNLTTVDTSFGDGRFGPSYTLIGESNPYTVTYEVTPADAGGDVPQKVVTVHVTRDDGYVTTAHTIIQNPAAGESTSTDAEPTDLTLDRVLRQPVLRQVARRGHRRVRTNVTPNATTTPTPSTPWTSGATQVKWTGPHRRAQLHVHDHVPQQQGHVRAHRPAVPHVDQRASQVRHVPRRRLRRMAMRALRTHRLRGQDGLTLIETLVSMIILVIITTMIIVGGPTCSAPPPTPCGPTRRAPRCATP